MKFFIIFNIFLFLDVQLYKGMNIMNICTDFCRKVVFIYILTNSIQKFPSYCIFSQPFIVKIFKHTTKLKEFSTEHHISITQILPFNVCIMAIPIPIYPFYLNAFQINSDHCSCAKKYFRIHVFIQSLMLFKIFSYEIQNEMHKS